MGAPRLKSLAVDVVTRVLSENRGAPDHVIHSALKAAYPWPKRTSEHWRIWTETIQELVHV